MFVKRIWAPQKDRPVWMGVASHAGLARYHKDMAGLRLNRPFICGSSKNDPAPYIDASHEV